MLPSLAGRTPSATNRSGSGPFRESSVQDLIGPLNEVERKNSPARLWLDGDADLFRLGPVVSVVGSRRPSAAGPRRARRLVSGFVEGNIVTLSGLALGIDTVAHRTAIERGGHTIAVLPTPLDRVTPRSNAGLLATIRGQHLAVSQFAPGSAVRKWNFTARNRTMALLSTATVIVEAGESSGTQHQAWEALRLGRPLYVLRSMADPPAARWVEQVRNYGAEVLSDDNFADVLATLPTRFPLSPEQLDEVMPPW